MFNDTIVAIASPPGAAARGIVRASGDGAVACVSQIVNQAAATAIAAAAEPCVADIVLELPSPLGQVSAQLYLWPGTRSYTREPSAEIHVAGAQPILEAIVERLCQIGARPAQPGEFTLRAFLAGQLDLTQAEAVLGVIHAETDDELRRALAQLAGGLARPLVQLRDQLLDGLAHLEAGLDFVEEDIQFVSADELLVMLTAARRQVNSLRRQMTSRERPHREYRVVLYGQPNSGKSSLLNALADGQTALVAPTPGTTRDYVTWSLSLDGVSLLVVDTAGIDPSTRDAVGRRAQTATAEQSQSADLRLLCIDASRPLTSWECDERSRPDEHRIVIATKTDLATDAGAIGLPTSSQTGEGLNELRRQIRERLVEMANPASDVVSSTAIRCRHSLDRAGRCLRRAIRIVRIHAGDELLAAELRGALDELGLVVGAVYHDDILDRIFSRFCIGK